jgi:hypothetical protein
MSLVLVSLVSAASGAPHLHMLTPCCGLCVVQAERSMLREELQSCAQQLVQLQQEHMELQQASAEQAAASRAQLAGYKDALERAKAVIRAQKEALLQVADRAQAATPVTAAAAVAAAAAAAATPVGGVARYGYGYGADVVRGSSRQRGSAGVHWRGVDGSVAGSEPDGSARHSRSSVSSSCA